MRTNSRAGSARRWSSGRGGRSLASCSAKPDRARPRRGSAKSSARTHRQAAPPPDEGDPSHARLLVRQQGPAAKRQAARELTAAAAAGALTVDVSDRYPLDDIAKAHNRVEACGRGRVLVTVPL